MLLLRARAYLRRFLSGGEKQLRISKWAEPIDTTALSPFDRRHHPNFTQKLKMEETGAPSPKGRPERPRPIGLRAPWSDQNMQSALLLTATSSVGCTCAGARAGARALCGACGT